MDTQRAMSLPFRFAPACAVAALLALTALVAPHLPALAQPQAVVTYDSPIHFGGPFTLTDQDGHARRDTDFRGELMLIYFGNTYCRDICPTELQKMSAVMDILGRKGDAVQPIFISFDPKRDTPARLQAYLANFHRRILGLTGNDERIAAVTRAYHVSYDRVELPGGDYDFDHTSIIFLMGREGQHIDHFGTSFSASQIADEVENHL